MVVNENGISRNLVTINWYDFLKLIILKKKCPLMVRVHSRWEGDPLILGKKKESGSSCLLKDRISSR